MKIIGQLLKVEQVSPYADPKTGEIVRPAFPRLHVLDDIKVRQVDARQFTGELPHPGPVDLDVDVRAYNSRNGVVVAFDLLGVRKAA